MDWSKLDLKKASVVRKEGGASSPFLLLTPRLVSAVDNVIKLISQAVENDQQDRLEILVQSIKLRTNQLEEFYARNEDGTLSPYS
jgi:hypothetical protein